MSRFALIIGLFLFLVIPAVHGSPAYALSLPKSETACDALPDGAAQSACNACMGSPTNPGTWTAIGCINTDPNDLLKKILGLAIGMAGGIAFLLILFGGLQIMTSAGNPEHLNAGRELVGSAVTGLLLIIFSIFLLQFIGVNIIGIPGFG